MSALRTPRCEDYEIAVIGSLPLVHDAISLILDKVWSQDHDNNTTVMRNARKLTTGRVGNRNVVLVLLSTLSKANTASTITGIRSVYQKVQLAFVIGVSGAAPFYWGDEISFGDVVISDTVYHSNSTERQPDKYLQRKTTDINISLAKNVQNLLSMFQTDRGADWLEQWTLYFLQQLQTKAALTTPEGRYNCPGTDVDKLFKPTYRHRQKSSSNRVYCECFSKSVHDDSLGSACTDLQCKDEHILTRKRLQIKCLAENNNNNPVQTPSIHVGSVASVESIIHSASERDKVLTAAAVIAFETQGPELWDEVPCILVNGICDYAVDQTQEGWQEFAAATAASVVKAMLQRLTFSEAILDSPRPF
ncbi:nucleoside phosphorylase domain-containing protein [Fusarium oxysporum]|nr:nucleoside phosphorylase domain-containing protein [Fusarium oxysporum]